MPHSAQSGNICKSEARRIAVLGQKDATARAIFELAHLQRRYPLQVLVFVPSASKTDADGCLEGLCAGFSFRCIAGATNDVVFDILSAYNPDLIVSILWPRRILDNVLALTKDCINFHPSLLPRHRGAYTQFWAIFDGDEEMGCTCHRMVSEFDAGRIIFQDSVPIADEECALSLHKKVASSIERCFQQVMELYLNPEGLPAGDEWNVDQFPYHRRRLPFKGAIDPSWPDDKIDRFIRAMYFPPHAPATAYTADGDSYLVASMEEFVSLRSSGKVVIALPPQDDTANDPGKTSGKNAKGKHSHTFFFAVVVSAIAFAPPLMQSILYPKPVGQVAVELLASRFSLEGHYRARCLDGSFPNYYVSQAAVKADSGKWFIYFQGGGWCSEHQEQSEHIGYSHDEAVGHPDLCSVRATGYHGSSLDDWTAVNLTGRGFLSPQVEENRLMHGWNRVLVRNCDGTAFLGSLEKPVSYGSRNLYFRGRDNAHAVIDALLLHHGMNQASEIVIGGCSAGAVAAVVLADELRAKIITGTGKNVFVAAYADSGFFPAWATSPPSGILTFPQFDWMYEAAGAASSASTECLAKGKGSSCLRSGVALPFVTTPVFVSHSLVDTWHLQHLQSNESLHALSSRLREEIVSAVQGPHGAAIDNCYGHCASGSSTKFGLHSPNAVFESWYRRRLEAWSKNVSGFVPGWINMMFSHSLADDDCYPGQGKHRVWHGNLSRVG